LYFVIFLLSLICAYLLLLPLAIKWELDKRLSHFSIPVVGALSAVVTILIYHNFKIGFILLFLIDGLLILTIAAALILYRFYRDPERTPPPGMRTSFYLLPTGKSFISKLRRPAKSRFQEKKIRRTPCRI